MRVVVVVVVAAATATAAATAAATIVAASQLPASAGRTDGSADGGRPLGTHASLLASFPYVDMHYALGGVMGVLRVYLPPLHAGATRTHLTD